PGDGSRLRIWKPHQGPPEPERVANTRGGGPTRKRLPGARTGRSPRGIVMVPIETWTLRVADGHQAAGARWTIFKEAVVLQDVTSALHAVREQVPRRSLGPGASEGQAEVEIKSIFLPVRVAEVDGTDRYGEPEAAADG